MKSIHIIKILILLILIILIDCNKLLAKNNYEYYMIQLSSAGYVISGYSNTEIAGGLIETSYNKETNLKTPVIYSSKQECKNAVKKAILEEAELSNRRIVMLAYDGNGVYRFTGAYARYVCINKNLINNSMINRDEYFASVTLSFFKKYSSKIPQEFKPEEFSSYTIFPLDEDQIEARKLSDELNKEINEVLYPKEENNNN